MDIDGNDSAPEAAPERKKGGWPKGKSRKARIDVRPDVRAAEVRPGIRTRKRKGGTLLDKYAVDPSLIPDGMSWEWKMESVYGRGDPGYMALMREQGWEPVMAERYPGMFSEDGYRGPIRREGLILMERPIELTREAMAEDKAAADAAVMIKEQQLRGTPEGTLPRHRQDGSSTVSINRTVERGGMVIE